MRECTRCAMVKEESAISQALTHFVCDYCRKDRSIIMFKNENTEHEDTNDANLER